MAVDGDSESGDEVEGVEVMGIFEGICDGTKDVKVGKGVGFDRN